MPDCALTCVCSQCVKINKFFKDPMRDQELFTGEELHQKGHIKTKLEGLRCRSIDFKVLRPNAAVRGEMRVWKTLAGRTPIERMRCLAPFWQAREHGLKLLASVRDMFGVDVEADPDLPREPKLKRSRGDEEATLSGEDWLDQCFGPDTDGEAESDF